MLTCLLGWFKFRHHFRHRPAESRQAHPDWQTRVEWGRVPDRCRHHQGWGQALCCQRWRNQWGQVGLTSLRN